ncbi:hypothetical protein PLICRDRAFT_101607 [Plicaturopsis crispa FD-325 SS-3]|nr:hypothetical protein PLICRDRAFT_101607 [Plicaturopsis crispa FD-325 SS-3]
MSAKPSHWPKDIEYIKSSRFHASVSPEVRAHILGQVNGGQRDVDTGVRSLAVIRPIPPSAHPAAGQYGLFAAKKIPPRTRILDYIGEVHCDDRPASDYDLSLYRLQDGTSVGVDASKAGNEARFINDYRGIRDKPNVLFTDGRTVSGELRMSVWSGGEAIKKGDELLVSYGKSWWRERSVNLV